jgi:ABC-type nitrate/sulfonate/bicarbonate transport system substrate-binding protein
MRISRDIIKNAMHCIAFRQFKFTDYGVPSYGYLVFVTSERSIRDRKEIISKFLRAIKNSVKFTLNNPQEGKLP